MPDEQKSFDDMDLKELAGLLDNPEQIEAMHKTTPDVPAEPTITETPEAPSEPTTTEPPEPEKEAKAPEEPAAAEPKPEEPDLAAFEVESRRLDEERRDTVISKLEAHNSRLAAQIGELKKAQRQPTGTREEIAEDDERLVTLQRTVEELQEAQRSEARGRLVNQEIQTVLAKPYLKGVDQSFINQATQKFSAVWDEAVTQDDPELARIGARAVLLSVTAEARRLQAEKVSSTAKERVAEQTRGAATAKIKASVSASGSAPMPRAEPALKDLSIEELDKRLQELTR